MVTKTQIADLVRERFSEVAERGRVMGRALKVRAEIVVTRRRMRATFADLGESVYEHIQRADDVVFADAHWVSFRERVDGLKAELRVQEAHLQDILAADDRLRTQKAPLTDAGN